MAQTIDPLAELKKLVTQCGSQRGAANFIGVSDAYLSDMLKGRRGIGPKVLEKLGLSKVIVHNRAAKKGAA